MNILNRKLLAGLVLGAGILSAPAQAAVNLTFGNPSSVSLGEVFDIDVIITGLDTQDLAFFDIDVTFDDSVVGFQDYTLGDELTDPLFGQDDFSFGATAPGVVNVAELSWLEDFSAQPDAFTLATLSFEALSVGTADFGFGYLDLVGADNGVIDPLVPGQVAVVPLPGAAFLLAGALVGLGLVGRRA